MEFDYISALVFDETQAINVTVLVLALAFVSLFIYKFYKSVSQKNLISLNLNKYNTSDHPIASKVWAILFYLIEYILVIPFLMLLWFSGFSVILFLLAKEGQSADYILLVAAALIGATRILAYISSEISSDLAKLFPFVALSLVILTPGEFSFDILVDNFKTVPLLLGHVYSYLIVLAAVEVVMRIFYTLYELWKSEEVGNDLIKSRAVGT